MEVCLIDDVDYKSLRIHNKIHSELNDDQIAKCLKNIKRKYADCPIIYQTMTKMLAEDLHDNFDWKELQMFLPERKKVQDVLGNIPTKFPKFDATKELNLEERFNCSRNSLNVFTQGFIRSKSKYDLNSIETMNSDVRTSRNSMFSKSMQNSAISKSFNSNLKSDNQSIQRSNRISTIGNSRLTTNDNIQANYAMKNYENSRVNTLESSEVNHAMNLYANSRMNT